MRNRLVGIHNFFSSLRVILKTTFKIFTWTVEVASRWTMHPSSYSWFSNIFWEQIRYPPYTLYSSSAWNRAATTNILASGLVSYQFCGLWGGGGGRGERWQYLRRELSNSPPSNWTNEFCCLSYLPFSLDSSRKYLGPTCHHSAIDLTLNRRCGLA